MVSRKRGLQEFESSEFPSETEKLRQIRNMWEFANLTQWISMFGRAVKLSDELDTEYIESEFFKPDSTVLSEIGLALLKFVSSHRGLTHDIFDEYTRRQYVARAPLQNPFGTEKEPIHFKDFDIFTKIRVLQQLTQWTMVNPERIRERTVEQKDIEQTKWRMEQFGRDSENRIYMILADNRLYRHTEPKYQPLKPKKILKSARSGRRVSERIKASGNIESDSGTNWKEDSGNQEIMLKGIDDHVEIKWECMAVNLKDYESFLTSIKKSRDANEKMLSKRITSEVLPALEKKIEIQQRKQAQKERELLNLQKLSCAKRSSRIASKMEKQKQQEELRIIERKRAEEIAMAQKEQQKWTSLEKERDSRIMTREQRLREREARRILHEEELAGLTGYKKKVENGEARLSERYLKAEIERKKQILEKLAEDDDWIFDCICGAYGQIDDGSHSIACDICSTWQHSKCVGVDKAKADRNDFSFICATCRRRADDQERAKTKLPITIKLNRQCLTTTPDKLQMKMYPMTTSSLGESTDYGTSLHSPHSKDSHAILNETQHTSPQQVKSSHLPKNTSTSKNNSDNLDHVGHSSSSKDSAPNDMKIFECSNKNSKSIVSPFFNEQLQNDDKPPYERSSEKTDTLPKIFHNNSRTDGPNSPKYTDAEDKKPCTELQAIESHNTQNIRPQSSAEGDQTPLEKTPADFQSSSLGGNQRASSSNFTSLLTSAPDLSPCQLDNTERDNTKPTNATLINLSCSQLTYSHQENQESALLNDISLLESHNAAALPPAATGVSPTKNHQLTYMVNGRHDAKTPSKLPPFSPLEPSPKVFNHSSPVKPSEPEKLERLENK
ncbi:putative phd finger domain protein [Erysiphe neolycopersici]|uniref:Putative phd finger domain protein n=1 Tax=Erysiphe neolycopersici TaxID=212602 RepID=A0A420HNG0_9PEZI|nr:putative phd finger domain protein [Erysiphe neolycopersici]